jgi:hypothetical protein
MVRLNQTPHVARKRSRWRPSARERQSPLIIGGRFRGRRPDADLLHQAQAKANVQLQAGALRAFGHGGNGTLRIGIMRDRFLHGEAAQVALAGVLPILDGFLVLAGAFELLRDHFGRRLDDVRKPLLQDRGDRRVKLLAPRPQHGRIGGILNERVLERIGRVGRRAAQEDELCLGQPDQRVLQHRIGQAGDRRQHLIGKIPADRGADLQHLARRAEAVDA